MAKTISKELALVQQDVAFTEVVDVSGFKLKIEIRSNAYAFQSSASVSVYSKETLKWNMVASIQGPAMKTPHGLYVNPAHGKQERHFKSDRNELLRQAGLILDLDIQQEAV